MRSWIQNENSKKNQQKKILNILYLQQTVTDETVCTKQS